MFKKRYPSVVNPLPYGFPDSLRSPTCALLNRVAADKIGIELPGLDISLSANKGYMAGAPYCVDGVKPSDSPFPCGVSWRRVDHRARLEGLTCETLFN